MKQDERRTWLLKYLINENKEYQNISIPILETEQKKLLRALMNVRAPNAISKQFIEIQNDYLIAELKNKKLTNIKELVPMEKGIYLWQGDITTLQVDAIVNAANSAMLGCFIPNHGCIDNAIHSNAGVQLRITCNEIMDGQGCIEPTGKAKITSAYNLPSSFIIHTVGPIIHNQVTKKDCQLLASCYSSCMELAMEYQLKSIAFCCISTGEFHFPNDMAATIAIDTVRDILDDKSIEMEVIFNVYKESDYKIYKKLLGTN